MAIEAAVRCARCGSDAPPGARFCATCGAPLSEVRAERRVVTVLFGDLAGFTALSETRDPEEIKAITDRAFADLGRIVADYGGHVDKIIGDEIMAVFGAPQAHEDDAERAVRAALRFQQRLEELSGEVELARGVRLQMHIGINTGEVVAGYVGGSDSYTVLGDTVNTARRIEDAAETGQILVGEATYKAVHSSIEFRPIGEVSAKGKRLPVRVWAAVAERALPGERTSRKAPLVGREEELALLDAFAGIVRRDRKPLMVTVTGEAGMGQSRIAAEFARRMHATGARILNGRSLPYGTASPAFAVEEMVREALLVDTRAEGADAVEWVRERLETLDLAEETDEILSFLGLLSRDEDPDGSSGGTSATTTGGLMAPGAGGPQAPQGGSGLLASAIALLGRVAEREGLLVLAFHEFHWAEDAVLDAVERLAREPRAPLLVLGLARPELLTRRPNWGSGAGSAVIRLEPLRRKRAGELLDLLAPGLAPTVRESVLDRAGGNPFYIEELAHLLVERGEEADDESVPASLQGLITVRLDGLEPEVKRLVQDAAVIGGRFWPGALAALRGGADQSDGLADLVARELVEPAGADLIPGEPTYRFRQAVLREVAEASVPKQVRAEQHAAVAAWLERIAADSGRDREIVDVIGYHFERAALLAADVGASVDGAAAKARAYLERAGDHAASLDAAAVASDFYERALAFATDDEDRLGLAIRLAEARVGSWMLREGEQRLLEVLAEARRLGKRSIEGKALRLHGDLMRMRGDGEAAREPIERALEIAKEVGDEREEAEGLRALGLLDIFLGRWSSSILWFRQALARYRALGDRRGEAWTLSSLGWASLYLRRFEESIGFFDQAIELFGDLGDAEGVGWSLSLRSWAHLYLGHLHEADQTARGIESFLASTHERRLKGMGFALDLQRILRAHVAVLLGRLDDAESLARAAVDNADRRDQPWGRALGRYPIFMALVIRRRLDAAARVLEEGTRAAETAKDPAYLGQFIFARAWLAYEQGRLDEADRLLDQPSPGMRDVVTQSSGRRWLRAAIRVAQGRHREAIADLKENLGRQNLTLIDPSLARSLLSELLAGNGDAAEALAQATTAVSEAGEDLFAGAAARLALVRAHLEAGDPGAAEEAARELLAILEPTDLVVQHVRAYALLARALDARLRVDESADAIDRARDLIAAMPADTDTAPLEAMLRA